MTLNPLKVLVSETHQIDLWPFIEKEVVVAQLAVSTVEALVRKRTRRLQRR